MRTLEEETLYYAIACFIVFGLPVIGFISWLKWDDKKRAKQQLEKSDEEYRQKYGELAYQEMLKERARNKSMVFSSVTNSVSSGVWYSRVSVDKLPQLIELNHAEALIGTPPHRLMELSQTASNQMTLTGEWPYPKKAEITTVAKLQLDFASQQDGRTGVRYNYTISPQDDPFAAQLMKITNFWLQNLIEKAT